MLRQKQQPLQHPSAPAFLAPSRHLGHSNNAGTNTKSTPAQPRGTGASSTATKRTRIPQQDPTPARESRAKAAEAP